MNKDEIIAYCMEKQNTYMDYPFGSMPICFKVNGKIFAQLNSSCEPMKITLKAHPEKSYFYRDVYPEHVVRGYHCPPVQQPYWNTITLDGFDDSVLLTMIDEAYEEVVRKFTKKEKTRLFNISSYVFQTVEASKDGIVLQALDKEEQLLGTIQLIPYEEGTFLVKDLYVKDSHRGLGIAKELLRRVDSIARQQGIFRLTVILEEPTEAVSSLYKKMLYKPTIDRTILFRKL